MLPSHLGKLYAAAPLAIAVLLAAHPVFAATPSTYIGPDLGLWTDPANWSAGTPTSSSFDAIISGASPITVQLNATEVVNNLTVSSPNTLSILTGNTLTLVGPTLMNSGSLAIAGVLRFSNNATISGAGNILLTGGTITGNPSVRITNDNFISGAGFIGAGGQKLINLGTISAATGTLTISPANSSDGFTNAGILLANGGTLLIASATINNLTGLIRAEANSVVQLSTGGAITGGAISAATGGTVVLAGLLSDVQLDGLGLLANNVGFKGVSTNNGTITVQNQLQLSGGTLVNSGYIKVLGSLPLSASTTISGAGVIEFAGGAFLTGPAGQILTNKSTLFGQGNLSVLSTNSGTIAATTGLLTLASANTNTGVLAAAGGTLTISASLTNTGGTITASTGTVLNSGGTITGGIIQSLSGGLVSMPFGNVTGSTINVLAGGSLSLGGPSLSNVIINNSGSFSTTNMGLAGTITNHSILSFPMTSGMSLLGNVTISGPGTVTLANTAIASTNTSRTLFLNTLVVGSGTLGLGGTFKVINNGTITANGGLLVIQPANATDGFLNAGVLRADGGALSLQSSTFENTNGIIEAVNNSPVGIAGISLTTINGGTLRTQSGGTISMGTALLNNVTLNGTIIFGDTTLLKGTVNFTTPFTFNPSFPNSVSLYGTVNNSSIISVGSAGTFSVQDNIAFTGGGTLHLNGFLLNSGSPHTVYNDNLIDGRGTITLTQLINAGTIVANSTAQGLTMNVGTLTNTGNLQVASGTLLLGAGTKLSNNGGTVEVLSGGVLILNSMNATGGTFQLHDGGIMRLTGSVLNNIAVQSSGGTLTTTSASTFTGTLTNSGSLVLAGSITSHSSFAAQIFNSGYLSFQTASQSFSGTTTLGSALQNSGTLRVLGTSFLTTNASAFQNSGTIIIDAATVSLSQNLEVTGSGSILMNASSSKISKSAAGLSDPYLFVVLTVNQPISGQGFIGDAANSALRIINNSTITATTGILKLSGRTNFTSDATDGFFNNGLLIADGGTLSVGVGIQGSGAYVINNGTISAVHNSTVLLAGPVIGGQLTAQDAAVIKVYGVVRGSAFHQIGTASRILFSSTSSVASTLWLVNCSLNGMAEVEGSASLALSETISNAGTLTIKAASSAGNGLFISGPLSLVGGGTIVFENGSTSGLSGGPGPGLYPPPRNFQSDNTFRGGARIFPASFATFTNNGLFDATDPFGFTFLASSGPGGGLFINYGTLRANGGPIILNGGGTPYLNNGLIQSMPGNTVFINAPVIGGTLSSLGLVQLAATTKVDELQLAGNTQSAFTATLDVKNSKFILQSDPALPGDKSAKISFLQSALTSGFHNGDWLGMGITSSTVAADQSATGTHMTALALFDNANLNLSTFGGQSVDTSSLLITTALIGDSNFDGTVDQSDFDTVINHWQTAQSDWTTGDLHNDGFVDLLDAVLIASHGQLNLAPAAVGVSVPAALSPEFPPVTVPEPSSLALLLGITGISLRRPRRRVPH